MATEPLDSNELCWLLGLTGGKRRKRIHQLRVLQQREGQSDAEYEEVKKRAHAALAFTRSVEDHLIRIVADIDRDLLREHHLERLHHLENKAA